MCAWVVLVSVAGATHAPIRCPNMLLWRLKHLTITALVLALLGGGLAVAYARWSRPSLDAETALAAGDYDGALAGYAAAEARFRRLPLAQHLLPGDYARAVYNQLALLHEIGDYDGVIAKAETAPVGAMPRFWTGTALFSLASGDARPETRLVWLSRAESEFKAALEAAPDEWDTKFNYEVTALLVEELRKKPSSEPDSLMQLLQSKQKQPRVVRKRG
jgi:hypothetical protein